MTDRIRVSEQELKRHWMSPDAAGLILDDSTQSKVVVMVDGSEYETPYADLAEATR